MQRHISALKKKELDVRTLLLYLHTCKNEPLMAHRFDMQALLLCTHDFSRDSLDGDINQLISSLEETILPDIRRKHTFFKTQISLLQKTACSRWVSIHFDEPSTENKPSGRFDGNNRAPTPAFV